MTSTSISKDKTPIRYRKMKLLFKYIDVDVVDIDDIEVDVVDIVDIEIDIDKKIL